MVDAYLKRQWIRAIVFIDSKAAVWASTQRDQWTDRSIYTKRDTPVVPIVCYVFGQSGTRGVHDPFVSCWHSDPVIHTLVGAHSRTNTRPHVRARRLCTLMRAYWSPSIPIKYRRFWGSPNRTCPRTETPVAHDVALRNICGLRAFDAPRERRSSSESWHWLMTV